LIDALACYWLILLGISFKRFFLLGFRADTESGTGCLKQRRLGMCLCSHEYPAGGGILITMDLAMQVLTKKNTDFRDLSSFSDFFD